MANVYSSTLRTTTSGDMVVPVNKIVELLRSRLTQSEIDTLLNSLISGVQRQVRPGDLITAELMNQVLAALANLETRVAVLEVATPGTGKGVIILEPHVNTVLRVGDSLIIKGQGLLSDSLVMIENQPLGGAIGSPDDRTLTFHAIPPLDISGGLPIGGKSVTLSVSNKLGGDSTAFMLLPLKLDKPIGTMVIAVSSKPPAGTKFIAGGTYTYKFKITADTKPDWKFLVAAKIGATNWSAIPSQTEIFIPAAKDASTPTVAELSVDVTIWDKAQSGDVGNLYIQLTAKDYTSFVWRSLPDEEIKVNDSATPIRKLNLALSKTTAGNAAIRTNADNSLTALIGPVGGSGGTGELQFSVTRIDGALEPGDYQVNMTKLAAFIDDTLPAKWQASIPGAPDGKVNLSGSAQPLKVSVTCQQGAPKAKLQLELTSLKVSSISGADNFNVEIRA